MSPELAGLPTATISDALDRLRIGGQVEGLGPIDPSMRLVGPAFTVRLVPVNGREGTVGDFVDDVPPGRVVAIDNGGRLDVTVWGDLLTEVAAARGLAGTVIDGACRDGARIAELGYPLFCRGRFMRTGKGRVRVVATGEPISLGTYAGVAAGDLVVGDGDGVVVVPAERAEEVAAVARGIRDAEEEIRREILEGRRLDDARERVGYHRLQTPR